MGGSFSSMFGCDGNGISGWGAVAVALLGPMGQLYQRITALRGSLDKWWLLIPVFYIPPFSFIPAVMMWSGCVSNCKMQNGAECPSGGVYDWWMLIPMIMKICSGLIVANMFPEGGMVVGFILPFIIQLVVTAIPLYFRYIEQCKFNGKSPTISEIFSSDAFNFDLFSFALTNSVIQNGIADITVIGLKFLPVIRVVFDVIGFIPGLTDIVDQIVWSIVYAATYIIMNMTTAQWRSDMIPGMCSIPTFGAWTDQSAAIILFILSCIAGVMNSAMSFASPAGFASMAMDEF